MATRYKRLSTKKIFIGKGELKHTSDRVVITFYVHNTEKMYLSKAINVVSKSLYCPDKPLKMFINKDINNKEVITYNRPFTLNEYLALPDHYNKWYTDYITSHIELKNLYLSNLILQHKILTKMVSMKIITEEDKNNIFMNLCENIDTFNHPSLELYMLGAKNYYESTLNRFIYLSCFNDVKFTQLFIHKLVLLVQNLYNKKVVFNIVNLNKMHLNSDIFTQAVSLKLRNRDNKLYRVLKSSLRKVRLPNVSRMTERYYNVNKNELFVNKIRNNNISSMFTKNNINDPLNNLLLDFFPSAENLKVNYVRGSYIREGNISLRSYVLKSLKHLKMAGIRIEAKGRLTRRFTASRSVFKMK